MKITQVKLTPLSNQRTVALASITYDESFVITGLKIINGQNGLFVAMPNRKGSDNEYHDIAFPITKEARNHIQETVLLRWHDSQQQFGSEVQEEVYNDIKGGVERQQAPKIVVNEDDLPF